MGDYIINNGILETVNSYVESITIPSDVREIFGTTNQNYAFYSCRNTILSVDFSNAVSLENIQNYAFYTCIKISTIDLSVCKNLHSIGNAAFSNCTSLSNLQLPYNGTLNSLGVLSFYNCSKLEKITLPNTITTLGSSIFQYSSLTELIFEKGIQLKSFPSRLIRSVGTLQSIEIPKSIESLPNNWAEYTSLTSITVEEGNENYVSKDNILYTIDTKELILYPAGRNGNFSIPDHVEKLGNCSFKGALRLQSVYIPNSVTSIGSWCFQVSALVSIEIPDSVNFIGEAAFDTIPSLKTVKLSNNISILKANTFAYTGITSIILPSNLVEIQSQCFMGCSSLSSVILPQSITKFGGGVFSGCSNDLHIEFANGSKFMIDDQRLIMDVSQYTVSNYIETNENATINIPSTVKIIDEYAFRNNQNIIKINFLSDSNLTNIKRFAFDSCAKLSEINIPSSVVYIGEYAFSSCPLIKSLQFEEAAKNIGSYAFFNMSSISEIIFNNNLITEFLQNTFSQCKMLHKIQLPDSLQSIGENCFERCTSLRELVFPNSFVGLSPNSFYQSGVVSIQFESHDNPDFTYIPDSAFYCSYNLSNITIPLYIQTIGDKAFSETNITEISIPNAVQNISSSCFLRCFQLKSLTIPNGNLSYIGYSFLENCPSLETITSHNPNFPVENGALYNYDQTELIAYPVASKTKYFYIPDSVKYIWSSSFYSAKNLISILIPEGSLSQIGYQAFAYCTNLTTINIPFSVTSVGSYAFIGCNSLICGIQVENSSLINELIDKAGMKKTVFRKCIPYNSMAPCSSRFYTQIQLFAVFIML